MSRVMLGSLALALHGGIGGWSLHWDARSLGGHPAPFLPFSFSVLSFLCQSASRLLYAKC